MKGILFSGFGPGRSRLDLALAHQGGEAANIGILKPGCHFPFNYENPFQ